MTALEPYQDTAVTAAGGSLQAWLEEAQAAAEIAAMLAPTPFVPGSLRVPNDRQATTANIAAALLTGQELGLGAMASLRSIDVVQGTPALRAVALRALVLAAGHDMWLLESTKTRCVMRGRRRGSDKEQEVVWTADRAKDLGLLGKSNWRSQPQTMLVARASAELARLIAADAILGLPYIAEELEDGDPVETVETVVQKPAKRTAQRKPRPSLAALPPVTDPHEILAQDTMMDERTTARQRLDEPPTDEPLIRQVQVGPRPVVDVALPDDEPPLDEPAPVGGITPAQLKMLHATLRDIKITDRDDGLALLSTLAGRLITSSKHLTSDEASHVIDELTRVQFNEEDEPDPA